MISRPYFAADGLVYGEASPELAKAAEGEVRGYHAHIARLHDLLIHRVNNDTHPPNIAARLQRLDFTDLPARATRMGRSNSVRERTERFVRRLTGRQAPTRRLSLDTNAARGNPWDDVVDPPRKVRRPRRKKRGDDDDDYLDPEEAYYL
jgi:hypothetical protein